MAVESELQPASTFPENLPPRTQAPEAARSWKQRNCPNMRVPWKISPSSYSVRHCPDKRTLWRRIGMIVIMVLRAGLSVEAVISSETFTQLVVFCVLAVLGLWFVAWCLAIIGDAVGERRVLGMSIGRKRLDVFLYGCAIAHAAFIGLWVLVWELGTSIVWLLTGLLIFAVAWICSWPPEYPPTNV